MCNLMTGVSGVRLVFGWGDSIEVVGSGGIDQVGHGQRPMVE